MRLRITVAVLLAAAVGLGAASCLGGEEPAEETALPAGPHARADGLPPTGSAGLAAMVLPQPAFGAEAAGLRLDERASGIQDNRERAGETADPYDTAEALSASGRQVGYAVDFFDTDLSALLDGGVFAARLLGRAVRQPESASASIVRELAELPARRGPQGRR